MEPVSESLRLLKRQAEIERHNACGMTLLEERELFAIRARLTNFPAAVRAIAELARARHQSVDQIRVEDVERWDARG
jgi:hypothetical protein